MKESHLEEIEEHAEEIIDRHQQAFLKVVAAGTSPNLAHAAIEYVSTHADEEDICDKYDVHPGDLTDTAVEITSHTDVSGLKHAADGEMFEAVFNLPYDDRVRIAKAADTDDINGKSNRLDISVWVANHYELETLRVLTDVIDLE